MDREEKLARALDDLAHARAIPPRARRGEDGSERIHLETIGRSVAEEILVAIESERAFCGSKFTIPSILRTTWISSVRSKSTRATSSRCTSHSPSLIPMPLADSTASATSDSRKKPAFTRSEPRSAIGRPVRTRTGPPRTK